MLIPNFGDKPTDTISPDTAQHCVPPIVAGLTTLAEVCGNKAHLLPLGISQLIGASMHLPRLCLPIASNLQRKAVIHQVQGQSSCTVWGQHHLTAAMLARPGSAPEV